MGCFEPVNICQTGVVVLDATLISRRENWLSLGERVIREPEPKSAQYGGLVVLDFAHVDVYVKVKQYRCMSLQDGAYCGSQNYVRN